MRTEKFNLLLDHGIERIITQLKITKAQEYSKNGDRLHNFRRIAVRMNISLAQAVDYLREKHAVSIEDMIADLERGKTFTVEYISEKCGDDINYGLLLEAAIIEKNEENKKTEEERKKDDFYKLGE